MSNVRVLVVGVPRSGTTWVGRVLGQAGDAHYVHEPDNHLVLPDAWWAKRGLGAYPSLVPGQEAPDYERLWESAFLGGLRHSVRNTSARLVHRTVPLLGRNALGEEPGGTLRLAGTLAAPRPSGEPVGNMVVKSVFAARSLEWLVAFFSPAVVIVDRHPFAVIASWANLGWTDFLDQDPAAIEQCLAHFGVPPVPPEAPWLDRAAWHYGFLTGLLREGARRHPEWNTVHHEELCASPPVMFEALCERLDLEWTERAQRFLLASNRKGRGYSTNRLWAEEIDGWRTRLHPSDQERVLEVLSQFSTVDSGLAAAS